ncbi:MAG: ATP-binding protein, partial [Candidatus Krumholzibacteria bacterium]|nr:ATP-binding protein [Candidatus Krumholzibacteria bacterium]
VALYSARAVRELHIDTTARYLEARAMLFGRLIESGLAESRAAVDSLCKDLGAEVGTRITVVVPGGRVIGDSQSDPASMENHGDRPEVVSAFSGSPGSSIRYSETLREEFLYIAVPIRRGGTIAGVVRTSLPLTGVHASLRRLYLRIAVAGLLVAAAALLASVALARSISGPVEEIQRGVDRFSRGDLAYRVPAHRIAEIGGLAQGVNEMAGRLEERIGTIERQRREQEAVFAAMVEGLMLVDADQRIMRMNPAAAEMLGTAAERAERRSVQEVVRNPYLLGFVARALRSNEPVEEDFMLRTSSGERSIQAHGAPLAGADGGGAVIVLNDITHLRSLEALRRDFVANVSHELRTPITSIKGFVETLLDGAQHDPADAAQFLEIIGRQADRMNHIIEDLLLLSGIEGRAEEGIRLERGDVCRLIDEAVRICGPGAAEKDIAIEVECPGGLSARMNEALLEQALVNLIENAIKYSEKGQPILIRASERGGGTVIEVIDRGCGIEAKAIPRLFERFFRVDKARSRKLGGTGLGLAIVKHIMQAHGGSVAVESVPGKGSTFALHLQN